MKTRNTITKGGRFNAAARDDSAGLTITEICCALAALALLLSVTLPALAMSKGRSQRIVCVNNLSRIGIAYAMWGADHDNRRPMMVPYWEGGVQTGGSVGVPPAGSSTPWFGAVNNQVWFHYFWLSNELVTPKLLVCPSDLIKRPATDWSVSSAHGFAHFNFRGNAVSYIVAHTYSESDRGLVSADRNLPYTNPLASCAYGFQGLIAIIPGGGLSGWRPLGPGVLHTPEGNLLFKDGSVEQVDSVGVASMFSPTNWSQGIVHFMIP